MTEQINDIESALKKVKDQKEKECANEYVAEWQKGEE